MRQLEERTEGDQCIFQSTHPLRGATNCQHPTGERFLHFNPRTPCGVRRRSESVCEIDVRFQSTHPLRGATQQKNLLNLHIWISIHAPLAGCDLETPTSAVTLMNFNPRTPCGVRRDVVRTCCIKYLFQSTHPLRGATGDRRGPHHTGKISIHAPLAGCDGIQLHIRPIGVNFNPRTPCGVRRRAGSTACSSK